MSEHDAALAESEALIAQKSRSFRLASRLLSRDVRAASVVLYAWCRRCDDAVDEPRERTPLASQRAVAELRAELDSIYRDEPQADPLLAAFQSVVRRHRIPRTYADELLAGMAMDAEGARYGTLEELLAYCYRVAGTVGLMMCHVMGVSDPRALRHAAHLGIAMQLTNICRDVAEDLGLGRTYLPARLLGRAGLAPGASLAAPSQRPIVRSVVRELLELADGFYRSADRGIPALDLRSALAVRTARFVYAAIGWRLRQAEYDPFAGRAVTPAFWKAALVVRALATTMLELPRRALSRLAQVRAPRSLQTVRYPEDVLPV
jgi:phytoene synthase